MEEAGSGAITATQSALVTFASQTLEKCAITRDYGVLLRPTESSCRTQVLSSFFFECGADRTRKGSYLAEVEGLMAPSTFVYSVSYSRVVRSRSRERQHSGSWSLLAIKVGMSSLAESFQSHCILLPCNKIVLLGPRSMTMAFPVTRCYVAQTQLVICQSVREIKVFASTVRTSLAMLP